MKKDIRNTKKAFKWIVKILQKHKITFEVRGGFAARAYGSGRELADIDIQVKNIKTETFVSKVKNFIIWGPKRYKDNNWDLFLLTLKYKGQVIDISGLGSTKIFNKAEKKWEPLAFDPFFSIQKEIYGIKVPIISLRRLINYKKKLSRRVDIQDVKNLSHKQ